MNFLKARHGSEMKTMLTASIVINVLALAFPLLMLQLYDRILPHQSLDTMSIFAAAVCVAVALESVTRILRSYTTAWISARFEHRVMMDLVKRVLVEPLSELERRGRGSVMEDFKSIATLKHHYSGQTFQQLLDLPFTVLYLAIIYVLNVWIGLLLTIGFMAFTLIVWRVCANDAVLMKKQKSADLKRNNFLNEALSNVHTLKSMSMESMKLRRYESLQESSARTMARMSYALEMSTGVGNVFSPLMTTLVVSLGAWLVMTHQLTNGELAACVLLGMRSLAPLQRLGGMWSKYLQDQFLRRKLSKLLEKPEIDTEDSLEVPSQSIENIKQASALQLVDISFQYPNCNKRLFKNINLNVEAGECIAISGFSDSGRSTLLQIMAGVLHPDHGQVKLDGQTISEISIKDRSEKIAYLSQNGQVFEGSLLDNVSVFDPARIDKAIELSKILGLNDFVSRMPRGWDTPVGDMATESLPPGYRQRIAIVRALSNDSNVLLVDDSTAMIDSDGDASFLHYLESIRGKVTIVIVSQRLAYLRLASRNLLLHEGQLTEIKPDHVLSLNTFLDNKNVLEDSSQLNDVVTQKSAISYQPIAASEYFVSNVNRKSIDVRRVDNAHEVINTLFKVKTDLSSCLPLLLKQINDRRSAREITESISYMKDSMDLPGFHNAMARLGYRSIKNRCKLGEIESRTLPCLFLPDDGLGFVALGRIGEQMRKSVSEIDGIELEKDLEMQGEAYFYEQEDQKPSEHQSWVLRILMRFWSLILQETISALVTGLVVMVGPLFMMMVYSTIIPSGAKDTLAYLAIGSVLSLASAYYFMQQRAQILSYIAGRIEYLFGTAVLQQVLRMPVAFTERSSVGAQLSRLQSFEAIRDLFTGPLASTLLESPATIVLLIALSIINPVALIIFVSMTATYSLLYWAFAVPTRDRVAEHSKASTKRNQFLIEMVGKMRTVRECGAELLWYERFRKISSSATITGFKAEKMTSVLIGISYFVMMMSALLIVVVTVPLVFTQSVTSGALIASMMLMWRVLAPIQTVFTNMSRIERVRSSTRQVDDLMKIQGESQNTATSLINRELKGQVEFARVSFRYSMNVDPALIGMDFKISSGEMVAISGPNGGGKSTVLKLILGMYQSQAGAILIDNIDIRQIAPVELRRMIGYAPQDIQLFNVTIGQNLRLAHPDSTDEEIYQALDMAGALNQVLALPGGLNYQLGEHSSQLSTSLRQKISLARCYLTRAPIMLFDEPGTGMDEIGDRKFIETMQALKGKSTVIFISHKPSHILLADSLLVFDKGYLKAAGPPGELLKKPVAA